MAKADDIVRYGLIGTGMMGTEHLWNLQHLDGAVVTAVADPNPGMLDWIVEAAGPDGPSLVRFADHNDLLDSGLVDAVVVASPNHTHLDVMLDVLARPAVHVLVEKPLCTTVADCRTLIDAAAGRPGLVWVGLEYRYMPPVARLVDEVRAGTVGTPRMVAIREHRYPFLNKVDDWNRFNRNTGGTLVEKCCHFFDLMNHILGERPVRVLASGGQDVNHLDESYHGETPDILDNAFVIVDYPSGARALLDLCMFADASHNQEELSVVGDRGKVEAFLPSCELRWTERVKGGLGLHQEVVEDADIAYQGFHHGSSFLEHRDLLDAIRTGGSAKVEVDDGLWSVAVGVAAHRSIDEGRAVTLDEVLAPSP